MNIAVLKIRVEELLMFADKVIATGQRTEYSGDIVNGELFIEFRTLSLSFLQNAFGETHIFTIDFKKKVYDSYLYHAENGRGILKAVKNELEGNWIFTVKGLISSELFADFIEMAEYFLTEGYKDAAAVMLGSVLEEHLRQLCNKNDIDLTFEKNGKFNTKRADLLNAELTALTIYNKLDQKSITTWLDLRNKAAHGKYNEYTKEQVELMERGISNFISRNPL